MITADRLRELLHYDPETGVFTRRVRTSNRIRIGDEAGDVRKFRPNGFYRRISLDDRRYLAHRLAWLYVHGEWPPTDVYIDHIDGNGLNNRIKNLRLATRSQNGANRALQSNNTSGIKGVHWAARSKKWKAQVSVGGRVKSLGYFESIDDATAAYRAATEQYFGSFARPK